MSGTRAPSVNVTRVNFSGGVGVGGDVLRRSALCDCADYGTRIAAHTALKLVLLHSHEAQRLTTRHPHKRASSVIMREDAGSDTRRSSSVARDTNCHMHDDASPPCWLDALPLDLIDREVARRHPSIPFYLAFAYRRFARYCRERYRLPRDPLSWFARVPFDYGPLSTGATTTSTPWCVVNYGIYLPDDHPRLRRIVEITQIINRFAYRDDTYYFWANTYNDVRYAAKMIALMPRYDGTTCVLHSWWDDDLDSHRRHGMPPVDVVAVEQNQYDALTMRLYNGGAAAENQNVDACGDASVVWYRYGVRHRDGDRPAVINYNGTRAWHRNGVFHRDADLPALVIIGTGVIDMHWYRNGVEHRDDDRPSHITADRQGTIMTTLEWRQNGNFHRDGDQPSWVSAYRNDDISVAFYSHGKLHCDDDNFPSLITRTRVAWHHFNVQWREIQIIEGAPHPYADAIETWLTRYLRSGDYAVSKVASCPYFCVARARTSCN